MKAYGFEFTPEFINFVHSLNYRKSNKSMGEVNKMISKTFGTDFTNAQMRAVFNKVNKMKTINQDPSNNDVSIIQRKKWQNTNPASIKTHEICLDKMERVRNAIINMNLKDGEKIPMDILCNNIGGVYTIGTLDQVMRGWGIYGTPDKKHILSDIVEIRNRKFVFRKNNKNLGGVVMLETSNQHPQKGSPEALERGRKAVETKITRGLIKPYKCENVKNYDMPKKNEFRNRVVSEFKKDEGTLTLSLESWQLKFVDSLPLCRHVIFEHDRETYKKLIESNRKNMEVYFADVSAARLLPPYYRFEQAFLDFCNTMETNLEKIKDLVGVLNWCNVIAFEFSVRNGRRRPKDSEINNYMGRTLAEINRLFPAYEILSPEVYTDTSPMIGIIIKRRDDAKFDSIGRKQFAESNLEKAFYIRLWAEEYALTQWGTDIKGGLNHNEDRFNEMCNKMPDWLIMNLKELWSHYNRDDFENKLAMTLQKFFVDMILTGNSNSEQNKKFNDGYLKFVKDHTVKDNTIDVAVQTIKEMETVLNIYKKRMSN